MLTKIIDRYCRWLDMLIGVMMAIMVVLVFCNVVLRYAFNSGISASEELSRWLFVWLTFMGAVVALNERRHLGTDFLVSRLPRSGKKACLSIAYLLMLFACWLVFKGSLDQAIINWTTTSAVMAVSVSYFYASGIAFSLLSALILVRDLLQLLNSDPSDAALVMIQESEDLPHGNGYTESNP
jgi:TRAP-type C4-dicarboxylate transport system permease small subunit